MIAENKLNKMLEDLLSICRKNLPRVREELITKSFRLSYEAHKNDNRDSGEPYFDHPYAVAKIVAEEIPLDDTSVIAALLHDVVEDTEISLDFIQKEFGSEVGIIVNGVTKIDGVFKGQDITQAEYYRKMLLSMIDDVRVILVKFADRVHNMRTLDSLVASRQRRIAKETLDIYAPFANRFGLGQIKWELEDLSFKYLNKDAYEEIAKKLKDKRKEREEYIKKFSEPLKQKLIESGLKFELSGRPKHIFSIYKKMMKLNTTFDNIFDLLAIRIILDDIDQNKCYYVLGIVNNLYKPISDRFKDYISIPKKNNYQSIHNTVYGPAGKLVEIQIRTRKMHEIAERGVAAHWKYKENVAATDRDLEDWVNWIRDIFENVSKTEASKEILSSFSLQLFQDEIYLFTPKGDLKILPINSTSVDFAFEIHSNVGYHCIGAKVNGKIVPLNTVLHSGDQVEIITSKNQHPNRSWLQFVVTHKAKSAVRKYLKNEDEKLVETGKDIFEKKLKKLKLTFTPDDVIKLSRKLKYENTQKFYRAIAQDKIDLDEVLNPEVVSVPDEQKDISFENFAAFARNNIGGVILEGDYKGIVVSYARCCGPIPGDPIIGYITIGEGIKIHRKDCKNLQIISRTNVEKLVPVSWPKTKSSMFLAGIKIVGEDSPGILKDLSNSITNYQNTNIKTVHINTQDSMFNGTITVQVNDLEHLNRLIERIKKNRGIYSVERLDSETA